MKKTATMTQPMTTNSIDPELAREKFAELRAQYVVTRDTIKAKGRSHAAAQEEILKPSEVFKQFRLANEATRLSGQQWRVMMDRAYSGTFRSWLPRRAVQNAAKKNFITLFTGNETSETGSTAIAMNKPWSEKNCTMSRKKCNAVCKNCGRLKKQTGLTIEQVKDINRRMSIGKRKPAVRRKRG